MDTWNGPLEKVDSFRYEIPRSYKPQMRTDGLIFIDEPMLAQLRQDRAPEQVANVATMPGIVGKAMAMPDIHWGYGFPIGGVAAFDYDDGVISPGGIGYDINCGVRLVRTDLKEEDIRSRIRALTDACFVNVPSGVGGTGIAKLSRQQLGRLATEGVAWSVENGYAWPKDPDRIEARGCLPDADFSKVSDRAITRGKDQVGSLGA
ncbi:MAG: RtcB family protein, partial [Thermoplasmata archaeon]|nr:RtcB family protein [Thermoplasmata archaeon]